MKPVRDEKWNIKIQKGIAFDHWADESFVFIQEIDSTSNIAVEFGVNPYT